MSVETCIEENCGGEIFCRNMCQKHYKKWYYSVKLTNRIKGDHCYKLSKIGLPSLLFLKELEGTAGGGLFYTRPTLLPAEDKIWPGTFPDSYKSFRSEVKEEYPKKYFNEAKENENRTYSAETVGGYGTVQNKYKQFKDL